MSTITQITLIICSTLVILNILSTIGENEIVAEVTALDVEL